MLHLRRKYLVRRVRSKARRRVSRAYVAVLFAKTFGTFPREYSPLTLRGSLNCFAASEIWCEAADRGRSSARNGVGRLVSPLISTRLARFIGSLPAQQVADADRRQTWQFRSRFDLSLSSRAFNFSSSSFFGIPSPVPKYISSGVCPLNAEWGRWRLC